MEKSKKTRSERIGDAVAVLGEAFRQSVTPVTIRAFDLGTSDLPIDEVSKAFMRAIVECKFMPTVHEIRNLAGAGNGLLAIQDRSLIAWSSVKHAVSSAGGYETVQFDDPVTTATVRALGGWERVCGTETGEKFDVWLKKEFQATYTALINCGISADQTVPLSGLCDKANSATGETQRGEVRRIETGLPPVPARLIRGELPKAIQATELTKIAGPLVASLGLPEQAKPPAIPTLSKEEQKQRLIERFGSQQVT